MRKLVGALIVVATLVLPAATLALILTMSVGAPSHFQLQAGLQLWSYGISAVMTASAIFALCMLTPDRPARALFVLSGTVSAWFAVEAILRPLGIDSPLFSRTIPLVGSVGTLLVAAGLWRTRLVPRWIPLVAASGVALSFAADLLIPQSVIDAGYQVQTAANPSMNWWMLPSTAGGTMTMLAWLAVGVSLLWPMRPLALSNKGIEQNAPVG